MLGVVLAALASPAAGGHAALPQPAALPCAELAIAAGGHGSLVVALDARASRPPAPLELRSTVALDSLLGVPGRFVLSRGALSADVAAPLDEAAEPVPEATPLALCLLGLALLAGSREGGRRAQRGRAAGRLRRALPPSAPWMRRRSSTAWWRSSSPTGPNAA